MSQYWVVVVQLRIYKDKPGPFPSWNNFALNDYTYTNNGTPLTDSLYDVLTSLVQNSGKGTSFAIEEIQITPQAHNYTIIFDNTKIVEGLRANTLIQIKRAITDFRDGLTSTKPSVSPTVLLEFLKNEEDNSVNVFSGDANKGGRVLLVEFSQPTPATPFSATQSVQQPATQSGTELDPEETPSSLPPDDPNAGVNSTENQEIPGPNQSTSSTPDNPDDTLQPPPQEQTPQEVDSQDQGRSERTGEDPNANKDKGQDIEKTRSIKPIFQPQKKAREIRLNLPPDDNYKKEYSESFGNFPVLWYNGSQIDYADIISLELYYQDNLPTLKAKFKDTVGGMKDRGTPLDDSLISLFINPRTKFLKPIHMDFKIAEFSNDNDIYDITGVINVKELFLRKFQSYSKKSSFKLYQQIAKDLGLGFNSNIDDTDDQMVWINTGNKLYEFINGVTPHTYKSDETYLIQYIDFYYCLNFVDVEKEMKRDIQQELGIKNMGIEEVVKTLDSDSVSRNFLTNEVSAKSTNSYFEKFSQINDSTKLSLQKGYLTKIKYYDELSKNFLVFEIDAITSDASQKILLRGAPQDESFFKENYNLNYSGRLDIDNVHKNYYYAVIQNKINYMELSKIGLLVDLVTPNFNLYKFQKIFVIVSNHKASPGKSEINSRFTGQWLISDLSYSFIGGQLRQKVELTKRDLEISPEEAKREAPQPAPNNGADTTQSKGNENPTDQEPPNPEQPQPIGPTASETPVGATAVSEIPPPPPEDPVEDTFPLTKDMWRSIYSGKINNKVIEKYYTPTINLLKKNNITTPEEIAKVLAYINIESKYLTFVEEDINWFNYYKKIN